MEINAPSKPKEAKNGKQDPQATPEAERLQTKRLNRAVPDLQSIHEFNAKNLMNV